MAAVTVGCSGGTQDRGTGAGSATGSDSQGVTRVRAPETNDAATVPASGRLTIVARDNGLSLKVEMPAAVPADKSVHAVITLANTTDDPVPYLDSNCHRLATVTAESPKFGTGIFFRDEDGAPCTENSMYDPHILAPRETVTAKQAWRAGIYGDSHKSSPSPGPATVNVTVKRPDTSMTATGPSPLEVTAG
jgi:hypothetical protein